MRPPCAEHGQRRSLTAQPTACAPRQMRQIGPSQHSPIIAFRRTRGRQNVCLALRAQHSQLSVVPERHSRALQQRCMAMTASSDADRSQPVSGASAGDAHGSSGTAATKKRLAVFVSGGGSNMRAIHAATLDGRLPASVEVVVSNAQSCGGVAFAGERGIPTLRYPGRKDDPDALTPEQLVTILRDTHRVDVVCLAGYMKLVPLELVRAFRRAMLNIHPALLPAFGGKGFYGERVHKAVLDSGVRFSGATVHFVEEAYDTGPVLAQRAVPVLPDDTPGSLAARVLVQEHLVYVEALQALCSGRVSWLDDGLPVVR